MSEMFFNVRTFPEKDKFSSFKDKYAFVQYPLNIHVYQSGEMFVFLTSSSFEFQISEYENHYSKLRMPVIWEKKANYFLNLISFPPIRKTAAQTSPCCTTHVELEELLSRIFHSSMILIRTMKFPCTLDDSPHELALVNDQKSVETITQSHKAKAFAEMNEWKYSGYFRLA